ncbi:MAG: nuclear transport factor 2 family protein [Proteobacteria bacterium]|nr:nuclear transport factor 2 family protein [Pseudomonadota bacterium]
MEMEDRLQRLEDDRAIRDLKASYLRAADTKDVEAMRACFTADAMIAFDGFPVFTDREAFLSVYRDMACAPGIFDIHHGANGVVVFDGDGRATGRWSLLFHNINLAARSLTQMGVEYDDVYIRGTEGRWRIAETRSRRLSALVQRVDDSGRATVTAMGEMTGDFGG